jgi:hypothetical protein
LTAVRLPCFAIKKTVNLVSKRCCAEQKAKTRVFSLFPRLNLICPRLHPPPPFFSFFHAEKQGNFIFLFFLEFPKIFFVELPPVLASNSDRQGVIPNKRLFSNVLSVACQHTTNRGGSRFFHWAAKPRTPRRIEGALSGWVLECYRPAGLFITKTQEPKMSHETIHRCAKCGIVPVYQTARITEPLEGVPSIIYRLQCPICGRYGAYCSTKQAAIGFWNREPFIPPRGREK